MSDIKEEVLDVFNVIEDSMKLNCPDDIQKLNEINETKQYIENLIANENDKVE